MKTIAGLAAATVSAAALLAGGGAQAEARPVSYVGKTSSGHQVTFKVDGNRMHDLRAGIRTSCVAIQGGGAPNGGADLFGFDGDVPLTGHSRFAFKTKNYLFWGDVTKTHDMWVKRRGKFPPTCGRRRGGRSPAPSTPRPGCPDPSGTSWPSPPGTRSSRRSTRSKPSAPGCSPRSRSRSSCCSAGRRSGPGSTSHAPAPIDQVSARSCEASGDGPSAESGAIAAM